MSTESQSIYLGVVPVTRESGQLLLDGAGQVVDWLVVMQQLDGRLLGDEVSKRGELSETHIDQLIVSDTIPLHPDKAACPKIKVLSVAVLLGKAIQSVHDETSVSSLFV